jgi:hypothetical protein
VSFSSRRKSSMTLVFASFVMDMTYAPFSNFAGLHDSSRNH